MPASLRVEIFPSDNQKSISFYVDVLQFKVIINEGSYAYLQRDNIFFGLAEVPTNDSYETKANNRRPDKGIEIVIEVDNLIAERDRIVGKGYNLDNEIKEQPWGLSDFRLLDPDGYYLRFTTQSPNRNGNGVSTTT